MTKSKTQILPAGQIKSELGISDNKTIPILRVKGIDIAKFRSLKNQQIILGSKVTVLSGRNGTMKTSLMGLIAHPFSSDSEDGLGRPLKTTLSEVFNLSKTYDIEDYEYSIVTETSSNSFIRSPVHIYFTAGQTNRHRVVVSGAEKGDGNLSYNTSFLNLKRLYPIVDLAGQRKASSIPSLTKDEMGQLKNFYEQIFPNSSYGEFVGIHRDKIKSTWAPSGGDLGYDWESISSGEDNLGSIFNRLVGFQRDYKKNQKTGGGILCIDEFEASLHPVAQIRLFEYLLRWAGDYKVQVIISTHSLGLISDIYLKHSALLDDGQISFNFVSKSKAIASNYPIVHNPPYDLAYKELTFTNPIDLAKIRKIKIFCEDETGAFFLKRIIKSRAILDLLDFHWSFDSNKSNQGISYTEVRPLAAACARFPALFDQSIVILDPDVSDKYMSTIKANDFCIRLPDDLGVAIERRIIYYIAALDNDDEFFTKFDNEKEAFLGEFAARGISLSLNDILDEKKTKISTCKGWASSCFPEFKKYITYYVNNHLEKTVFIDKLLETLNSMNAKIGLPPIKTQG